MSLSLTHATSPALPLSAPSPTTSSSRPFPHSPTRTALQAAGGITHYLSESVISPLLGKAALRAATLEQEHTSATGMDPSYLGAALVAMLALIQMALLARGGLAAAWPLAASG